MIHQVMMDVKNRLTDFAFHGRFPSTCTSTWSCWSACTWCQPCCWKSLTWLHTSSTLDAEWSASSSITSSGWGRGSRCWVTADAGSTAQTTNVLFSHRGSAYPPGPPESMREHVVAASKAMKMGDWRTCHSFIINEKMNSKVWDLFPETQRVREMLVR